MSLQVNTGFVGMSHGLLMMFNYRSSDFDPDRDNGQNKHYGSILFLRIWNHVDPKMIYCSHSQREKQII